MNAKEAALKIADMLGALPPASKAPVNTADKAAAQSDAAARAQTLIAAAVSCTDNAYLLSTRRHSTPAFTPAPRPRFCRFRFPQRALPVPLTDTTR